MRFHSKRNSINNQRGSMVIAISAILIFVTASTVALTEFFVGQQSRIRNNDYMDSMTSALAMKNTLVNTLSNTDAVLTTAIAKNADGELINPELLNCVGSGVCPAGWSPLNLTDRNSRLLSDARLNMGFTPYTLTHTYGQSSTSNPQFLCSEFSVTGNSTACPYRYNLTWRKSSTSNLLFVNGSFQSNQTSLIKPSTNLNFSKKIKLQLAPYFVNQGPWYVMTTDTIDVNALSTSPLIPGIAMDPLGRTLTISAVGPAKYGNIVNSGNKIRYTPTSITSTGRDQINITITNTDGRSTSGVIIFHAVTPSTWTGFASNIWDATTSANWCGSITASKLSCTNTGPVPTAADVAIIDDTCVSTNCSPTFNYNLATRGLKVTANTLTQGAGNTMILGSSGYTQTGGTFTGSNSNITINGPFLATGGTFTSTSSNLILNGAAGNLTLTMASGFTFNHASGMTQIMNQSSLTIANQIKFYDLRYNPFGAAWTDLNGSTMEVERNFTIGVSACGSGSGQLNNGTIKVFGDLISTGLCGPYGSAMVQMVGNSNSVINFATPSATVPSVEILKSGSATVQLIGSVGVAGSFIFTSGGNLITTGSTLNLAAAQANSTFKADAQTFENLSFRSFSTTEMFGATSTVTNTLLLAGACGGGLQRVNNGTIIAKGDINLGVAGLGYCGLGGSAQIIINGTSDQNLIAGAPAPHFYQIPNVTVNKPSATLYLIGRIEHKGDFNYIAGNVNPGLSTVKFATDNGTIKAAGINFYNILLAPWGSMNLAGTTITAINEVSVTTDWGCGGGNALINNGVIESRTNFRVGLDSTNSPCGTRGSASIRLTGSATDGILEVTNPIPQGGITIDKPGKVISLSVNTTLESPGPTISVLQGTLNMNSYNLTIPTSLSLGVGTSVVRSGVGVLRVGPMGGAIIPDGPYSSGTVGGP